MEARLQKILDTSAWEPTEVIWLDCQIIHNSVYHTQPMTETRDK